MKINNISLSLSRTIETSGLMGRTKYTKIGITMNGQLDENESAKDGYAILSERISESMQYEVDKLRPKK